jgi:sterol desaturase/sphingolipid hydroxylase (fatty acid hydroxylase superfamily)
MDFFKANIPVLLLGTMFVFMLTLETFFPLRQFKISRIKRIFRNLSLAVLGLIILKVLFYSTLVAISTYVEKNNWGLLGLLEIANPLEKILAIILLDYTLYWWHVLNHKVKFFWRFHLVHHTDMEMDVSTASRFHFGELILSVGYRIGQIIVIGVDPITLIVFESTVTLAAQFHHSNIRLPLKLESSINKIFVTPRMHTIHHSLVLNETNSNYSAIFSLWDRLGKSIHLNVPQELIRIGVPNYQEGEKVAFFKLIIMPFKKLGKWALKNGEVPTRAPNTVPRDQFFD